MAARRPSGPGAPRKGARPRRGPGQRPGRATRPSAAAPSAPQRARLTGRAAVLVLVVAVLVVSYASSLRAYLEQRQHIESLRASISDSQRSIDQLQRERQRWKDPAYVRAEARERFGWVLPGEIGFQVIGEDGEPLDHEDSLTDPATVTEASAPPVWWQTAWASVEAAGNPEEEEPAPTEPAPIRPPKRANR